MTLLIDSAQYLLIFSCVFAEFRLNFEVSFIFDLHLHQLLWIGMFVTSACWSDVAVNTWLLACELTLVCAHSLLLDACGGALEKLNIFIIFFFGWSFVYSSSLLPATKIAGVKTIKKSSFSSEENVSLSLYWK